MGSELFRAGLDPDTPPEVWLLENPKALETIHQAYVDQGADWIQTNTFGANPIRLFEHRREAETARLNTIAASLARKAAGDLCFVIASLGPSGVYLPPQGNASVSEITKAFSMQTQALEDAGVDAFLIETMLDVEELKCIFDAIRGCSNKPVLASICFRKRDNQYETIVGTPLSEAIRTIEALGVIAVGANCMLSAKDYPPLVSELNSATSLPILAQPNAGQPVREESGLVYPETPDDFLTHLDAIHSAGATLIGGCCGTTPQTVKGIRRWADGLR